MVADWADVEAAVLVGASAAEMAVLGDEAGEGERAFRLLTIRDESAELRARTAAPESERPVPIELSARVGHFGDPERERVLLEAVARRLRDLAGVDYRPLD